MGHSTSSGRSEGLPTWYNYLAPEQQATARRQIASVEMVQNGAMQQDTFGQLSTNNFSDEILDRAVERGWITRRQANRIRRA